MKLIRRLCDRRETSSYCVIVQVRIVLKRTTLQSDWCSNSKRRANYIMTHLLVIAHVFGFEKFCPQQF